MKFKVVVNEDINILKAKGGKIGKITTKIKIDQIKLKQHQDEVGTIEVYVDGKIYKTATLGIQSEVKSSTVFDIFLEIFKEIFLVS